MRDFLGQIGRTPLLTAEQEVALGERIEAGVLARERLDQDRDALTARERADLEWLVRDGRRAKDHMVRANLRLVVSIARRYATSEGMPLADLVQEGTIGMMHAVDKFDHRRGLKFSTYATWWIKQAVSRAHADQSRTIRLPAHMADVLYRVKKALAAGDGQRTPEELAAEVGVPVDKVVLALRHARDPVSLHVRLGDDGAAELGDLVPDDAPDPGAAVAAASVRPAIDTVLKTLTEREAEVISLRYGLSDDTPMSLDEIGRRYGLTRERIRQIEAKGMGKLRQGTRTRILADLIA
ncbi:MULTISPECIES: sigma-70 family RNA polymerase sigma factor [unclassified Saccharothrix]|uniref:sigma-70 family RNA polymerase sigma factor n=1 Tax=unclassified Saccharothrix TaxID=2593673 RepID=UPI00307EFBB8